MFYFSPRHLWVLLHSQLISELFKCVFAEAKPGCLSIHECIKVPEIKLKKKLFLKLIGFLVGTKPLSYLWLLNVVLTFIYLITSQNQVQLVYLA